MVFPALTRKLAVCWALKSADSRLTIWATIIIRRRERKQSRSCWVRLYLHAERRLRYNGHYDPLLVELRIQDHQSFFNFLRMPPDMFDEPLKRVGPRISKQDTNCRKALESGLKLAATIRHLVSGDKYPALQYDFRVPRNTCCIFIPEVCHAIIDVLKEVISCPVTPGEWRLLADAFSKKWNARMLILLFMENILLLEN